MDEQNAALNSPADARMANALLAGARRIVVKLGSRVAMAEDGGLAVERLRDIVRQCAALRQAGREVLLVSSGAVGLGLPRLPLTKPPSTTDRQAAAAIGQGLLMAVYGDYFGEHGLNVAQILLTGNDLANRAAYLNLRATMERLLKYGIVPVINENDTVSTTEIELLSREKGFGDNDRLSALIAAKLDADLLVILTNVAGIYTDNPAENPDARLLGFVEGVEQLNSIRASGKSDAGRGGMTTKLDAARMAALSGVHTWITTGFTPDCLSPLTTPDPKTPLPGTLVKAKTPIRGKKRWIGLASGFQGVLIVNAGAGHALKERNASLLPVGVIGVEGEFAAGQVVSIQDETGTEIGRGIARYSAAQARLIRGQASSRLPELLGSHYKRGEDELVHRHDLIIYAHYYDTQSTREAPP